MPSANEPMAGWLLELDEVNSMYTKSEGLTNSWSGSVLASSSYYSCSHTFIFLACLYPPSGVHSSSGAWRVEWLTGFSSVLDVVLSPVGPVLCGGDADSYSCVGRWEHVLQQLCRASPIANLLSILRVASQSE